MYRNIIDMAIMIRERLIRFVCFYSLCYLKVMSDSSLKLKRVESPDRKVLFYFDEVIYFICRITFMFGLSFT